MLSRASTRCGCASGWTQARLTTHVVANIQTLNTLTRHRSISSIRTPHRSTQTSAASTPISAHPTPKSGSTFASFSFSSTSSSSSFSSSSSSSSSTSASPLFSLSTLAALTSSSLLLASYLWYHPHHTVQCSWDGDNDHTHIGADSLDPLYISPCSESNLKVFGGSGNLALAQEVASRLGTQLGRATIGHFADGECQIQIHDNVRGKDVYIIQPTSTPTNDNLMELLLMVSTFRRSSAARVIAIIPYYAYARQLDREQKRATIAGADVALMLESVGVDQVIAVDLHRGQVQGFFESTTPVENLDTTKSALPYFVAKKLHDPVVVSPCGEGVRRATKFRDALAKKGVDANLALIYVRDASGLVDVDNHHHTIVPQEDTVELVGDVQGKDVIIVDDMIDTGSRVTMAAQTVKNAGARRIFAYTTHGLLTGDAVSKINESPLTEVVIFNTIPLPPSKQSPRIRQLSVGGLIAECIRRVHNHESLAELY